jgi:tRNA-splicing ligase RtcB (3'-phosphate/5'-hydroxy nucleic acid ligase)
VNIACRMRMSILPVSFSEFNDHKTSFKMALESETRFGVGEEYRRPKQHKIIDENWGFNNFVQPLKNKAARQLGIIGYGNHFSKFGNLILKNDDLGLKKGNYIALLTHTGFRGTSAMITDHYSK